MRGIHGRPGTQVVGHLRLYTARALRGFLSASGFDVVRIAGAPYHDVPRPLRPWTAPPATSRPWPPSCSPMPAGEGSSAMPWWGVASALVANVLYSTGFVLEKRALAALPALSTRQPARVVRPSPRQPAVDRRLARAGRRLRRPARRLPHPAARRRPGPLRLGSGPAAAPLVGGAGRADQRPGAEEHRGDPRRAGDGRRLPRGGDAQAIARTAPPGDAARPRRAVAGRRACCCTPRRNGGPGAATGCRPRASPTGWPSASSTASVHSPSRASPGCSPRTTSRAPPPELFRSPYPVPPPLHRSHRPGPVPDRAATLPRLRHRPRLHHRHLRLHRRLRHRRVR